MHRNTFLSLGLASLLAASVPAQVLPAGAGALDPQSCSALGLARGQRATIDVHGTVGQPLLVAVEFGAPLVLQLEPSSVRAPGFRVLEDNGHTVRAVAPGPVRTYRGSVMNLPGSFVAASLLPRGLHARINLGNGTEIWVEPVAGRVAGAAAGMHVAYRHSDILKTRHACGTHLLANPRPVPTTTAPVQSGAPKTAAASATSVAELACDADYEYFLDYGSTTAVANRIQTVINTMNTQYERDVDITHTITTILVRSSSSQPYTSSDAQTLLNQLRSEWTNNQTGVQRDVTQLFSGKSINGGTIGIAWLGVICNSSYGYGMVESDFNNNFASATDLSAHELGHNWNADHCSCTSFTMNPFITTANVFSTQFTTGDIIAHRNSRSCLGSTGGGNPTLMRVASIAVDTQGVGRGRKQGRAIVTITDDLGNAVGGVLVSGSFSGTISETVSGTTNSSGSVTLNSSGTAKGKVRLTFCVTNVSGGSLPYDSGQNTETCDNN